MIRTSLPGRAFELRRLHARNKLFERRLKIGRALPLVGRREFCELLLEIEALQLHRQRLVRRSVEEECRLDLAAFDIVDKASDLRYPIEADAVLQDGANLRLDSRPHAAPAVVELSMEGGREHEVVGLEMLEDRGPSLIRDVF